MVLIGLIFQRVSELANVINNVALALTWNGQPRVTFIGSIQNVFKFSSVARRMIMHLLSFEYIQFDKQSLHKEKICGNFNHEKIVRVATEFEIWFIFISTDILRLCFFLHLHIMKRQLPFPHLLMFLFHYETEGEIKIIRTTTADFWVVRAERERLHDTGKFGLRALQQRITIFELLLQLYFDVFTMLQFTFMRHVKKYVHFYDYDIGSVWGGASRRQSCEPSDVIASSITRNDWVTLDFNSQSQASHKARVKFCVNIFLSRRQITAFSLSDSWQEFQNSRDDIDCGENEKEKKGKKSKSLHLPPSVL